MTDITRILHAMEKGEPGAAGELWPLVYDELRRLAARKLSREKPGQTIDATGLVHEAYLRLVRNSAETLGFANQRHFFVAAAEAMRRILIERARRKQRLRHGGGKQRQELQDGYLAIDPADARLLAVDEALQKLAADRPDLAEIVRLRYFAGLTVEQTAAVLETSTRTIKRHWAYASAWLKRELAQDDSRIGPD